MLCRLKVDDLIKFLLKLVIKSLDLPIQQGKSFFNATVGVAVGGHPS